MRRLWNAAYEMGRSAEVNSRRSEHIEDARQSGFKEGRRSGFEEGRQVGEKTALTMDAFEVSFAAGKMAGIATGMELGGEAETQRWKDGGHFEGGTCRAFDGSPANDLPSLPPKSLLLDVALGRRRRISSHSPSRSSTYRTTARFFRPALKRGEPFRHIAATTCTLSRLSDEMTTPTAIFLCIYYHWTNNINTPCDTAPTRSHDALEHGEGRRLLIVGASGLDLDAGALASAWARGFRLEIAVGNEDVALRKGADAVVRTDASSRRSGRLVSSLRMFRRDLHLASSQHSDIAGFPLEWHQRIQGLPQRH
ncbi:hypothetical protein B0H13DRAFT_2389732 [Mycena leptocephala]|nr:hypothetical protein B0H13DRAFT_2389732 [Mycena leptocephala]